MNIKDNLVNYLFDKDYLISMYDDYLYIFNYKYLDLFNDEKIVVDIAKKTVTILGTSLLIVKITKEELLIKGVIRSIEVKPKNE